MNSCLKGFGVLECSFYARPLAQSHDLSKRLFCLELTHFPKMQRMIQGNFNTPCTGEVLSMHK
ncbi:hypothetical protein MIZ03_3645 [Rhodoferax lithotrophicus]|uniref:Uncharacterized protein n=1 Tax=Rhodoferax lithotrophicus TaxID=2798804 RepID=A0ABN6D9Q4_9BURK|nr:hypothetical protein MIZ03_3645 [Rhodoferax sp. MIZ03]